ncbi:uncharacterized protein LOC111721113 [Sarcophilus harrisii]|uniref:uncharacterized protein LOC111721113 n=1 Tax=Sarcophilus harrisii TaxID=9305 RepID=UPI001301A8DD|nr:uncharacterized protein LOC111721113 [Sarcophilus harrisii]
MASITSPGLALSSPPSLSSSTSSSCPSVTQSLEKTILSAPTTILVHLQESGSKALRKAIASEQTKSWLKAIEHYTELLNIVYKVKILKIFDTDLPHAQLLFETYYHLAVAYQNLNLHKKAVEQLTLAEEIASVPKNGCEVGCNYETFYHTPMFSRRAFSHVICGKKKEAIKDANKAINLDRLNPDVYCARALVWNSYKETKRAIYDLNKGLRLNPYHACALILRGATINSLNSNINNDTENRDHEKAYKICQKSKLFLDVTNFKNPKMAEFFEKFLWSLNVPHTVTSLNLLEGYSPYFSNLPCRKISQNLRKVPRMPSISYTQRDHLKKSATSYSLSHVKINQWL